MCWVLGYLNVCKVNLSDGSKKIYIFTSCLLNLTMVWSNRKIAWLTIQTGIGLLLQIGDFLWVLLKTEYRKSMTEVSLGIVCTYSLQCWCWLLCSNNLRYKTLDGGKTDTESIPTIVSKIVVKAKFFITNPPQNDCIHKQYVEVVSKMANIEVPLKSDCNDEIK